MKKTIVLLTIVLAFVAAPVFAEVSISGDLDFGISSDFAAPEDVAAAEDGDDGFEYDIDDLDLDISADVDEFTNVSFSLNFDDEVYAATPSAVVPGTFTVATDITGAFGIDGAADVTLITGYNDYHEANDYNNITRTGIDEICDQAFPAGWVIGADVVVNDAFTIAFSIDPNISTDDSAGLLYDTNVQGDPMEMWIQAYGTFDAVSAEAYYVTGNVKTWDLSVLTGGVVTGTVDDAYSSIGANASYAMPMDDMDLTFGAGVRFDMYEEADDADTTYSVSGTVVMGAFDAGVAIAGTTEANEIDATMGLAIDAGYQVNETVLVYGGVTFEDLMSDDDMCFTDADAFDEGLSSANAGMEVGAKIMAGACEYYVGYQLGSGDIYNRTDAEGMFLRVQADY